MKINVMKCELFNPECMSQAIELLGDFEVNANQETFRLLFGEIKGIEMFTQFRVSHLFSMISFFYSLKREDKKRLIEFICSERVLVDGE